MSSLSSTSGGDQQGRAAEEAAQQGIIEMAQIKSLVASFISAAEAIDEEEELIQSVAAGILTRDASNGGVGGGQNIQVGGISNDGDDAADEGRISIHNFIAQLNPELTSEDDRVRYRATLLVSEILQLKPNMAITPAALHLIILCFCQKLSDSACIVPALDALRTLIVHHGYELGSKYRDAADILERLLKDVQVQAMVQVIRQKALDLTCILLEFMSKSSMLDKNFTSSAEVLEDLIALGDGEKDPRCLLLFLRVHKYVSYFSDCIRGSETLQKKVFYSFACYFPITFEPAADDPYGMTRESLIDALEEVFASTPSLLELVVPFLSEQITTSSSEAAQSQGISILVRLSKMYELATIFRDNEKAVTESDNDMIAIGRIAEQMHSIAMASEDVNGSALKELVTAVQEICKTLEAQVYSARSKGNILGTTSSDTSLEQVMRCWGAFAGTLLKKSIVSLLENGSAVRGRIAGKLITAIACSGYLGLENVLFKVLPQALQKMRTTIEMALNDLPDSQYVEMEGLLRCSVEVSTAIEEVLASSDGVKLISCTLNVSEDLQGFNALLHVSELGDVLGTSIKESVDSVIAGEKLRGEVSLAVAQLLSFLIKMVPHEPSDGMIEAVDACLTSVVESALSSAQHDSYSSNTSVLLIKCLLSGKKNKYKTVIQATKKRAMDCIGEGAPGKLSASEILATIGSVTTEKEVLRDCVKSLNSIVKGQDDNSRALGTELLQNLISSCVLGVSEATGMIIQEDGEFEAVVNSALVASDKTVLSASSRLIKIIISGSTNDNKKLLVNKVLEMSEARLGLRDVGGTSSNLDSVDYLTESLTKDGNIPGIEASLYTTPRLKRNVATILEENVVVESCTRTDTSQWAIRLSLMMIQEALLGDDMEANQPLSRCFAALIHNLSPGEMLDRILGLGLSLSTRELSFYRNPKLVMEVFVWSYRAVVSRPVIRPNTSSLLPLLEKQLGMSVASSTWEQVYTEALYLFLPGAKNEGSVGALLSRVQVISDDTITIPTVEKRSMLWRQRVWGRMYGKLRPSAMGRAGSSQSTRCQALLLCGLAAGLPPALLTHDTKEMTSLVQEAILYCSSEDNGPGSLNYHLGGDRVGVVLCLQNALLTMEKILQLDVMYAHSFVQFMAPLLIKICNTSKISRIRGLALNCLLSICLTIKGSAYEMLRKQVIKGLKGTLNDRKRSIRKLATDVIDSLNEL